MPDMHTIGLKLNRLILAAIAKGAQTQHDIPKEDRITDAELDAMKAEIMSLVSAPVRAEAAKTKALCRCQPGVCLLHPGLQTCGMRERSASPVREAEPTTVGELVAAFVARCREIRNGSPNAFYAHVDRFCKAVEASPVSAVEPLKALVVEAVELLKHVRVLDCGAHYCRYCPAKSPEWEHTPSCPYEESQVVSERARVLRQKLSAALEGAATTPAEPLKALVEQWSAEAAACERQAAVSSDPVKSVALAQRFKTLRQCAAALSAALEGAATKGGQ